MIVIKCNVFQITGHRLNSHPHRTPRSTTPLAPLAPLAPRTTTRPITSNALLLRVVTVINPFGQADPSGLSVIVIFILDFGKENWWYY